MQGRLTYVVSPLEAIKRKVGDSGVVQYLLNNEQVISNGG